MKRTFYILTLLLTGAATLIGQRVTGRLATSVATWEGRTATREKTTFVRGTQNVNLDVAGSALSFSTSFFVSNDFSSDIGTDPELRLSTLALRGRDIFGAASFSLGRHFVASGIGSGYVDGLSVSGSVLDNRVTILAYGGYDVVNTREINLNKNFSDNALYGARLAVIPMERTSIGLAYMNRSRESGSIRVTRIDSLFNPYTVVLAQLPEREEMVSADATIGFVNDLLLNVRGDYDILGEKVHRTQVFARYALMRSLSVTGEFIQREPRIGYNNIFSVFTQKSSTEIEGGVEYEATPLLRGYARFGHVAYTDESSQRLIVGGSYDFLSFTYTQNFGYAGELNGVTVQAVYPMMERMLIPSVALGFAGYKASKDDPSNTVVSVTAGATWRPVQSFSTNASVQWAKNPVFSNDVRLFLTASYWFSDRLNIL